MSFVSWFWFFIAVCGWVIAWVASSSADKKAKQNEELRKENIITTNRMNYFRKKCEKYEVFDFEKVNDKGEK